jgi:uncharacterized protein DUF3459
VTEPWWRDAVLILHFTRDLSALRKQLPDLRAGAYAELPSPPGTWASRRVEGVTVAVNLGEQRADVHHVDGVIALSTNRERDGERVAGSLVLGSREGVVLAAA